MKRIKFNRILSFFAALCLLVSAASAAVPTEDTVQPRYTGISKLTADLSISSSGYASCYGYVRLSSSSYSANMTVELQRSGNGTSWTTIKDWSTSGSYTLELDKGWYVVSGYYYQVVTTVEVYNSSGSLVGTAPGSSVSVYY